MLFFKTKKNSEKEAAASSKKTQSLQEIGQTRILTAEGWKRRAMKLKKGSKKG